MRDNLSRIVPAAKPLSRGKDFPSFPLCRGAHPHLPGSADNPQSKNDPRADLIGGKVDSISGKIALFESENRVFRPGIITRNWWTTGEKPVHQLFAAEYQLHSIFVALKTGTKPMVLTVSDENGALNPPAVSNRTEKFHSKKVSLDMYVQLYF